ncbi:MAG TPA: hypothetical protein VFH29_05915, partial [Anaerolineales bacterium]|nr:hypothetical protein [Anaerolineales bacterium]
MMKAFESLEQLEQMCHLSALAGHEKAMIEFMKQEMLKHLSDVHVDRLGNVIGVKPGTDPAGPKVMIFAHMDEVGFMVRKIDADGFVRITRVGGIPEKSLPAQRVVLQGLNGPVTGVIGPKSHHLTPAEEKFKVVPINDLFVDIGAHSKQDAEQMGVQVGTPITYQGFFEEMPG